MTIREIWAAVKQRLRLIEDCKAEWRKFSTWITTIAMAAWGTFAAFPGLARSAWDTLPGDLRANIPHQDWIAFACLGAVLVAKFIKQKKPDGQ
jgi:hypothetical protein